MPMRSTFSESIFALAGWISLDVYKRQLVADAGYKTPAIAKLLLDDGITPLLPYKRPMTKDGFFKKAEYVYDEYFDCYVCPVSYTHLDVYKRQFQTNSGTADRSWLC